MAVQYLIAAALEDTILLQSIGASVSAAYTSDDGQTVVGGAAKEQAREDALLEAGDWMATAQRDGVVAHQSHRRAWDQAADNARAVAPSDDDEVVEVVPLYVVVCRVCKRLEGRHTNMDDGECTDCNVSMTPCLSLDDAVLFESDEDMEDDPDPVGLTDDECLDPAAVLERFTDGEAISDGEVSAAMQELERDVTPEGLGLPVIGGSDK